MKKITKILKIKKSTPPVRDDLEKNSALDLKEIDELLRLLKKTGIKDFVRYLHSPWRIMGANFLAGIFRGLGMIIGVTIVFAILLWALAMFVDFPLIGEYFQQAQDYLNDYVAKTDNQQHFENLEMILQEINQNLINQNR